LLDEDGVQTVSTYDADDRLVAVGPSLFEHDANGNLTKRTDPGGITQYAFDALDRLTAVQAPGGTAAQYVYDGNDIRVSRTVGGVETQYLFNTQEPFAQALEERDDAGGLVASYTYAGFRGGRVSRSVPSGGTSYYHGDAHGSARLMTDDVGDAVAAQSYDAFGRELAGFGTAAGPYGYNGEQTDDETGLQYLRARYYAPGLGRFMSSDAIARSPHGAAITHPYLYAGNNPVNVTDPSGHFGMADVGAAMSVMGNLARTAIMSIPRALLWMLRGVAKLSQIAARAAATCGRIIATEIGHASFPNAIWAMLSSGAFAGIAGPGNANAYLRGLAILGRPWLWILVLLGPLKAFTPTQIKTLPTSAVKSPQAWACLAPFAAAVIGLGIWSQTD